MEQRIVMLLSVLGRGKSKNYLELLQAYGIRSHMQSVGHGTAPSEMMDIFGLGTNDKDIVISFAQAKAVRHFASELSKSVDSVPKYGGLAMVLPLSAMNRLFAGVLLRESFENVTQEGEGDVKNENKYRMIAISVNQGYTDAVMQVAKRAGATGGTVIRARFVGTQLLEQLGEVEEEKEIVLILAPTSNSNQILEDVNRECGLRTPAQGMVCALPVEKAFKV